MAVKVRVDLSGIEGRLRVTPALKGAMALAAMRGMEPYVRMDTGALNGSVFVRDGKVVYPLDYASATYHNTRNLVNTQHHPKATPLWGDAYSASGAKEVKEAVTRHVTKG